MKTSASAPALTRRGKAESGVDRVLGSSQSEVRSEHCSDSAAGSRSAGRPRKDADKKRIGSKQAPADDRQEWTDKSQPSLPSAPINPRKISPPSLLEGVSSVARFANNHAEDRTVRLARINDSKHRRIANAQRAELENFPDANEFTGQLARLANTVMDMKTQHDGFQPMNANQKARAALFGRSGSKSQGHCGNGGSQFSREENEVWKEKVDAWKYTRRIEPELPPLERQPREFEPIICDQAVVKFNAQPDVIMRSSPEAHLEWLAYRGASREAHHLVVSELRARRRADFLAKRRISAFKSLEPKGIEEEEEETEQGIEEDEPTAAHWLIALTLSSFVGVAMQEIRIRNMSVEERALYVQQNAESLRRSKTASGYIKQAMVISSALEDPETKGRMDMMQCMFIGLFKTRVKRRHARTVQTCLIKWSTLGTFALLLKRFAGRIRYMQNWWRKICVPRLAQARMKLNQRWLRIERAEIVKEIKARDLKEAKEARLSKTRISEDHPDHPGNRIVIPMEDRIQLQLIEDKVRSQFIDNELRTRRYLLLPQTAMWEDEMRSWDEEMSEAVDTAGFLRGSGLEGAAQQQAFRWPPQRPTYMPTEFGKDKEKGEQEIVDMIERARAHPDGGGWTEIPKKVAGESLSTTLGAKASRKNGDFAAGCDEEHPFGHASQEDLQAFQLGDKDLPLEFREKAPGVQAPEWRQII